MLPLVLIGLLVGIAGLHAYWGLLGRWPAKDEATLAGLVIGKTAGGRMPPPFACLAVATAILVGVGLIIAVSFWHSEGLVRQLLMVAYGVFAAVFILRGLAGYVPALWASSQGTPFVALNTRYYSPLCLAIGAGLIANLIRR
jgi:hypothetical protein